MKKALLFIVQIIVIVAVSMFLIKNQWPMQVTVKDYTLTTNSSFFLLFLFVFLGVFILFHKAFEAIVYAPNKIKKKLDYKKRTAGLDAIINGLFYLSIDSKKQALKEAKTAIKKIPKHTMTNFLSARAHLANGDYEKVKKDYRNIIKDKKYMSLGFNGLIEIALLQNNDEDLYKLSRQAFLVDRKNHFALLNLIDCQIDRNEIADAKENIKKINKLKTIDKDQAKLRLAEMAYVDAIRFQENGDIKSAIKEILPYYDLDVDYLDLYVSLLVASEQVKKAKNTVKKEWKKNPYYQIASIWMTLGPKDKTKKIAHSKELLKDWSNSHIAFELIAKACVDAEIWGEARDYLTKAIETEEKISHYLLMAKVEKLGFKNHEQHDFWIRKAEKGIL